MACLGTPKAGQDKPRHIPRQAMACNRLPLCVPLLAYVALLARSTEIPERGQKVEGGHDNRSGSDRYAHTRTLLKRSRSVGGATLKGISPISFLAPYGFTSPLTRTHQGHPWHAPTPTKAACGTTKPTTAGTKAACGTPPSPRGNLPGPDIVRIDRLRALS
jgi:hypothetical protein